LKRDKIFERRKVFMEFINEKPLTTGEIAKYCHVTPVAVLKWIKAGKIQAYSTPGGHFRVLPEDFKVFLKEYVMPVPRCFQEKEELHILVADDDDKILKILEKSLNRMDRDVHVYTATNGYEACVKVGHFPISIALVDIMMPNMDGLELCRIIKGLDETNDIEFIVVSGYIDEDNREKFRKLGIDNFIEKPFKVEELISKVIELSKNRGNKK
jgi:excisionase family DNA binding protein